MPVESHLPCGAEAAPHPTAHLGGDAERCPTILLRDIDGLKGLLRAVQLAEEVLLRPIPRNLRERNRAATYGTAGFQLGAKCLREIGHLVEGGGTLDVEPLSELFRPILRLPEFLHEGGQFF